MSTLTTIQGTDVISTSRTDINNNFSALNTDKIETSYLDTDTSLTANSDSKIATQKAVKTFVESNVNPTGRSWNEYAVDAVGTDSYAITLTGLSSYVAGQTFKFKAGTANTGACTLNINGLGAKTIKKDVSTDLATGDILANQIVIVTYDGTNMQLVSKISAAIPAISYKAGSTTYDLSTASGTQTIAHGLGITPTMVRINGGNGYDAGNTSGTSFAVYFNSTEYSWYSVRASSTIEIAGANFRFYSSSGEYQTGVITVDSTNITITWTKTGSATGTAYLTWEVQY